MKKSASEILRNLERRVARLEKQSVKDDPRVPKVGDILWRHYFPGNLTLVSFYKVIEVGDSVIVKELAKEYIEEDRRAQEKGGRLAKPSTKFVRDGREYKSEEIREKRNGYAIELWDRRRFEKWDGKPKFETDPFA